MHSHSPEGAYTIADLRNWDFHGTSLAVVGHPVRHSISPQMHNAALGQLAQRDTEFSTWRYFRFEIEPTLLPEALPLFHQKNFFGLNLTVPHKEIAFPLVATIDDGARRVGAVNTLKREAQGYRGFNTDGYGLAQGIANELHLALKGARVLLLGAGGAARAAAVRCLEDGCASLSIVNRNPERLAALLAALAPYAAERAIPLAALAPDQLSAIEPGTILVNATSLGLKPDDPSPLPAAALGSGLLCYDMIYNPPATKLMAAIDASGGASANGLSMLIHQGAKALEIWTGQPAPVETMANAAHAALRR